MKRILNIILLGWLLSGAAQAQYYQSSGEDAAEAYGARRFSPHYYTVRNIFRNHRFLQRAGGGAGQSLLPSGRVPLSAVEIDSDVVFRSGTYEFHARIQGVGHEVHLRKRDGRWVLEVRDDYSDAVLAVYKLDR
jgi:hypothetical protein